MQGISDNTSKLAGPQAEVTNQWHLQMTCALDYAANVINLKLNATPFQVWEFQASGTLKGQKFTLFKKFGTCFSSIFARTLLD